MDDKNGNLNKKRKTDGQAEKPKKDSAPQKGGKNQDTPPPSNGEQSTEVTLDGALADTTDTAKSNTNITAEQQPTPHISDFNVPAFRILRKLLKAGVRAHHNKTTLEKALEENRLPRGLCPKKIPLNIPDVPIKFQLAWEKAHSDLNRTLTEILKNHWTERFELLNEQYNATLNPLKERSSQLETTHIESLLKKSETETLELLKNKDEKKKVPKTDTVEEEENRTTESN